MVDSVLVWTEKEKGERIVHGWKPQRSREATRTFGFGQNGITKDICDHPQRGHLPCGSMKS